MKHYSVLLEESISLLNVKEDGIYVDGTLGRGGHSEAILQKLKNGHLYAFDLDLTAIAESKERLKPYLDKITFIHSNYANIKEKLNELNVHTIDGMILDLGVSSPQFDDPTRGFSYRFDAKLDMRMNIEQEFSAYNIVNEYEFNDLMRILYKYGEEKNAKLIARGIEKNRELKPITTTFELVDIIKSSLPAKILSKKGHPAKQTFQALRIEVNKELASLEKVLEDATKMLNLDGIMMIITFHSLEDRIVKDYFKELASVEKIDKHIPIKAVDIEKPDYSLITKKVILPSDEELNENKRSTSAKLRGIKRDKL